MGKRGREQTHQEITSPQLQPVTTGKDNNNAELFCEEQGTQAPHKTHQLRSYTREKKPKTLDFENQCGLHSEKL